MPVQINGATSGSATLQATDAATVTLTLPATSGTLSVSGGSPSFTAVTTTSDSTFNTVKVGLGNNSVSTNTAVGQGSALGSIKIGRAHV